MSPDNQPLSAKLDKYPLDACRSQLGGARKAPAHAVVEAGKLLPVLRRAAQFLLEKSELGLIESCDKGLRLTMPLSSGKWQQTAAATVKTPLAQTRWAPQRSIAWLEFIAGIQEETDVEVARTKGALVLRAKLGKQEYVYMSSDL